MIRYLLIIRYSAIIQLKQDIHSQYDNRQVSNLTRKIWGDIDYKWVSAVLTGDFGGLATFFLSFISPGSLNHLVNVFSPMVSP